MKKKKKKRTTINGLLLRYSCIAVLATILFAVGCKIFLSLILIKHINENESDYVIAIEDQLESIEPDKTDNKENILFWLTDYQYCDVEDNKYFAWSALHSKDSHAAALISDGTGNIEMINELNLYALRITLGEKRECSYYTYDKSLNIPEINELCQKYEKYQTEYYNAYLILNSMYVNKKNHTFIPHTGTISAEKKDGSTVSEDFSIDTACENYELIKREKGKYFCSCHYDGISKEQFDNLIPENLTSEQIRYISPEKTGFDIRENKYYYSDITYIKAGDKYYYLYYSSAVDCSIRFKKATWFTVFFFFFLAETAAFIWGETKNSKNQTRYRFEDHQKALTNNLAHDLKTPLTAISGYTENALKVLKKGEIGNSVSFLESILENISTTDLLISKTLEMNNMPEKKIQNKVISLDKLANDILQKYDSMIASKKITFEVQGKSEIKADEVSISSAIENLISNAVYYTNENGSIKIFTDRHSFIIINSTLQKTDTKDLTMPFVRGDKARSNCKGSGLGLSIVKSAAELNNMKLKLSSTDSEFQVCLKF